VTVNPVRPETVPSLLKVPRLQCRAARDHSWIEIEVPSPIAVAQDCEAVAASCLLQPKSAAQDELDFKKSLSPITEAFKAEESLAGLERTSSYRIHDLANVWL